VAHKELWERINRLLRLRGMTQQGLADCSGVSRSYLNKIRRGEADPSLDVLRRLARCLRVHNSDLIKAMYDDYVRPLNLTGRAEKYRAYDSAFIADVTIPENTVVSVKQVFEKVWDIQNTGAEPWIDFRLVDIDDTTAGHYLEPSEFALTLRSVPPGETIRISVYFKAPNAAGTYISRWKLLDKDDEYVFPDKLPLTCRVVVEDL
jgi:transcriptional regulator with XRE-family HTH domain